MPEGPEIRRAADRIARVLVGETLDEVRFAFPELKPREEELAGRRVEAVETRGKAMLTRFDNGLALYSHNQLYGRWYTVRRGKLPNTRRSLRVALHTPTHSALLYSASEIEVLDADGVAGHRFLGKLGPDILDERLSPGDVVARLGEQRFRGRSLAALYLDQAFLAGLGNYLRSEILFLARVDPVRRPKDLDPPALERLGAQTLAVARRSYETGGVTLDEDTHEAAGGGRRERFWLFARAGKGCRRCGATIVREARAGRRLYRCPGCQS